MWLCSVRVMIVYWDGANRDGKHVYAQKPSSFMRLWLEKAPSWD